LRGWLAGVNKKLLIAGAAGEGFVIRIL